MTETRGLQTKRKARPSRKISKLSFSLVLVTFEAAHAVACRRREYT